MHTNLQRNSFKNGTVTAKIGTEKRALWAAALFEEQGEIITLPYMVKKKQIYTEHNHQEKLIGIELTVTVKLYSN